jgi:C_GCAxxG_C_C family probable redox protein
VLLAVSKATKQDYDCIPRIAAGLAGGLGVGEVCGAVSGAVMAIGLVYGEDQAEGMAVYTQTKEFMRRFAEQNSAVRCNDLTGLDMSDEKAMSLYFAQNLKEKTCDGLVSDAVQIFHDLMED